MTTKSMTNVNNNVQASSLNYSHHYPIHQHYLQHHTNNNHSHTMSIRAKHFTIDSLISNKETENGTKRATIVDDILMENSGEHKHRNRAFHHSQQPSFNGHHHWNNDPMLANNLLNNRSAASRKRSLDNDKYRSNKSLKSVKHKLENDTNNSDDDTNNNDEDEEINVDDIVDIESTGSSHDDECVSCKSDPGSDHQPISPNPMAASAAAYHSYDPLLSGKFHFFRFNNFFLQKFILKIRIKKFIPATSRKYGAIFKCRGSFQCKYITYGQYATITWCTSIAANSST